MSDEPIAIIAVHGNGGGSFRWDRLPFPLDSDVVLNGITLPGFEGTDLPEGPITMSTFSRSVGEIARATQRPVVVLGHGIGGAIALDLAAREPDLVDGLILHAPVAVNLDERLFPRLMRAPIARTTVKRVVSCLPVRSIASRFLFPSSPQEFSERFLREYGRAKGFEVMFDIIDAEWFDGLPSVAAPTVILWGGRDRVLDVGQADALERVIPHAIRQIEDGWGHYPMIESPDEYACVVADLARSLVRSPA